jgi:hypothetical protein
MPTPSDSKPNPTGARRRRHHRRFYGLSDQKQAQVFQQQRDAIVAMFDAMEEYFCAELDAKLESLDELAREPQSVDAEFSEEPDASIS